MQSTLKQFVRDWSGEGAAERNACYGPILTELQRAYPDGNARNEMKAQPAKVPDNVTSQTFLCLAMCTGQFPIQGKRSLVSDLILWTIVVLTRDDTDKCLPILLGSWKSFKLK